MSSQRGHTNLLSSTVEQYSGKLWLTVKMLPLAKLGEPSSAAGDSDSGTPHLDETGTMRMRASSTTHSFLFRLVPWRFERDMAVRSSASAALQLGSLGAMTCMSFSLFREVAARSPSSRSAPAVPPAMMRKTTESMAICDCEWSARHCDLPRTCPVSISRQLRVDQHDS